MQAQRHQTFSKPLGLRTESGKMAAQPPMWRNGRRNGLKLTFSRFLRFSLHIKFSAFSEVNRAKCVILRPLHSVGRKIITLAQ
jgi:hypothetical protein